MFIVSFKDCGRCKCNWGIMSMLFVWRIFLGYLINNSAKLIKKYGESILVLIYIIFLYIVNYYSSL